jgi:hypothetical protein
VDFQSDEFGQISRAGLQYLVDVHVASPRFKELKNVMDSKIARCEADAFRSAAKDYLELADELTHNALEELKDELSRQLGQLGMCVGFLVFVCIVSYQFPLVTLGAALCTIPVLGTVYKIRERWKAVIGFDKMMHEDFDERLEKHCDIAGQLMAARKGDDYYE